ncbi:MAG: hypothetical protein PHU80_12145, partial [Kiritimatiellae bacterium]|nr:hypothetical protein [Kiritimatiellia bacterium]
MKKHKGMIGLMGMAILLAGMAEAQNVFVAPSVAGASDGASWATAYTNLQTAVNDPNAVNGIWVKQGVYAIQTPIFMSNNGAIYGGFAGTETLLAQRDWRANLTTISNAVTATSGDPDHRVFNCDNRSDWRLDGLTICK